MNELIKALEAEQANAAAYLYQADQERDAVAAAYWEGYQDAINNAAALIYGPTPLDESERN